MGFCATAWLVELWDGDCLVELVRLNRCAFSLGFFFQEERKKERIYFSLLMVNLHIKRI